MTAQTEAAQQTLLMMHPLETEHEARLFVKFVIDEFGGTNPEDSGAEIVTDGGLFLFTDEVAAERYDERRMEAWDIFTAAGLDYFDVITDFEN